MPEPSLPGTSARPSPDAGFDLDTTWELHPQVAVRPESFGALLYHFGTRRLSFLKDHALLAGVRALAERPSARDALLSAGVGDDDLDRYGAQLRLTRLRPSGRGADVWDELHPTSEQRLAIYRRLVEHGDRVLTGDSFFHLSAYGEALPGLNLCGAGRVVCLIDPVGDVYACPRCTTSSWPATSGTRAASPACGGSRSCSPTYGARRPAAPARGVRPTTPAAAGAWRRSSSPGCPLTVRTPSASRATARRRCARPTVPAPPAQW